MFTSSTRRLGNLAGPKGQEGVERWISSFKEGGRGPITGRQVLHHGRWWHLVQHGCSNGASRRAAPWLASRGSPLGRRGRSRPHGTGLERPGEADGCRCVPPFPPSCGGRTPERGGGSANHCAGTVEQAAPTGYRPRGVTSYRCVGTGPPSHGAEQGVRARTNCVNLVGGPASDGAGTGGPGTVGQASEVQIGEGEENER